MPVPVHRLWQGGGVGCHPKRMWCVHNAVLAAELQNEGLEGRGSGGGCDRVGWLRRCASIPPRLIKGDLLVGRRTKSWTKSSVMYPRVAQDLRKLERAGR